MEQTKKVELKFCECCGGLWLRREGTEQIYCRDCVPIMKQMAEPRKRTVVSEGLPVLSGGAFCA